jgi:hypothetical protein
MAEKLAAVQKHQPGITQLTLRPPHGQTRTRSPFEKLVSWFEPLPGSRNHAWRYAVVPAAGATAACAFIHALKSRV